MPLKHLIKHIYYKLSHSLFFISLASLFWFILRTGPKPSRAQYPCQRAALAQSSFLLIFLPLARIKRITHYFKTQLFTKQTLKIIVTALGVFLLVAGSSVVYDKITDYKNSKKLEVHRKHLPIGSGLSADKNLTVSSVFAQGADHKVVSVQDDDATNWNYSTGYFWQYIDQNVVSVMMERGVRELTGQSTSQAAWQALIPYQPGDQIAIKPNFNASYGCTEQDNEIDPVSETFNAVIAGLKSIGVPENSIWIFDATHSRVIPNRFINPIRALYPGVRFFNFSTWHTCNEHTTYVAQNSPYATDPLCPNVPSNVLILPPQILVDAEHLINVPIFKSHGNYPTLALKNHYGTVYYSNSDRNAMHTYFEAAGGGGCNLNTQNLLADINNNPLIRDKTRLIIGDGLFGNPDTNWQGTKRWTIFGNDDPNILFFSKDPVASESVMTDYIMAERGWQDHGYMHAGALIGLGVHEHWDNFTNKHYTAIDYVNLDLDTAPGDITPPSVPTSLTATAISSSQINLSWTASTDNVGVTGYRLERCQGSGCTSFTQIATPSGTSYSDTGLSASTTYVYTVAAYDAAGNMSGQSTSATATTQADGDTTPPVRSNGSPSGALTAGTTQTTMSVTTNENATCRYSTTANTSYSSMTNTFSTTGGTSHSTTITGLTNGQSYTRYVRCQDTAGNANTSDYVITFSVAAPDTTSPSAPTNLTATAISSSQINLSWTASTDNVGVTGYRIYRCQGAGCNPSVQVGTSVTNSYSDTGLSPSTTYVYAVAAYDAAGNVSGQSSSANATTQSTSDTTPPAAPGGVTVS